MDLLSASRRAELASPSHAPPAITTFEETGDPLYLDENKKPPT